jgi:fructose-1,6-bisphosphatase/inositol monophosphatase family enzyme
MQFVPGSRVVGEEATGTGRVPLVNEMSRECPVWTIDPLDGTQRFVEGDPAFAILNSLTYRGETVAAWIHFPISGIMIVAEKSAGAFIGDRRLRVLDIKNGDKFTGMVATPAHKNENRLKREELKERHHGVFSELFAPPGAALEYTRLVTDFQPDPLNRFSPILPQCHFFLRLLGNKPLMPWDHFPGKLVVEESGGQHCTLSGMPTNFDDVQEGILVAPRSAWDRLHTAFKNDPLIFV